jgi:hypothetical protein
VPAQWAFAMRPSYPGGGLLFVKPRHRIDPIDRNGHTLVSDRRVENAGIVHACVWSLFLSV